MIPQESEWAYHWHSGAASQKGGRAEQEDSHGIFSVADPQGILAVVADGMGGHLDGALAAKTVFDMAHEFARHPPPKLGTEPLVALEHLCRQMHDAINARSETARSTVVMVWLHREQAYWLNIGDSRLYHFRQGQRLMRTRDHSAVQLLMDLGEINESQMATHPAQNRLFRCLGGDDQPMPDTGYFTAQIDDMLVLCSDGVWEQIEEYEFWEGLKQHDTASAAKWLAEQAAQRGGDNADNATLVLLRAALSSGTEASGVSQPWLQWFAVKLAAFMDRTQKSG